MEENVKKIGFFKRIIIAITDFEKYIIFAAEKLRTSLNYLVKLIAIFSIVLAGVFTYKFYSSINNGIEYIKNNIEEISYKDNTLSVNSGNELILQNEDEVIQEVIVNTNATDEQQRQYIERISKQESGIVILKDKLIYKNQLLSIPMQYNYENIATEYGINEFTKNDVIAYTAGMQAIGVNSGFLIIAFIYLFVIYFTTAIVDAATLAALGFIIARIIGMKIRYKATFNMAVYSLTLSILLNIVYLIVNEFTGITVDSFNWMYTTISCIYMLVAIFMIKADFINKQKELMKIVEEQEKVRRELEEQEQRKKEQEKDKKEDNKQDKKEEKKKQKEKQEGEEKNKGLGEDGLAPQNCVENQK